MLSKPIYPILFLRTNNLKKTREFYEKILNFPIALEQSGCLIFKIGNYGYWGFCESQEELLQPAEQICLTVVVKTRAEVDNWHEHLVKQKIIVKREPVYTEQYKIYNGFYLDPNGYTIEIQAFDEDGKPEGHDNFLKSCSCID